MINLNNYQISFNSDIEETMVEEIIPSYYNDEEIIAFIQCYCDDMNINYSILENE